jgi:hypothetical protein
MHRNIPRVLNLLKPDRADTTYAGGDNHRYDPKELIEAWRADT